MSAIDAVDGSFRHVGARVADGTSPLGPTRTSGDVHFRAAVGVTADIQMISVAS
jgi:hypothetical protein